MALPDPRASPRRRLSLLAALFLASVAPRAGAQHLGVTFGPPPDWVVPSPLGESRPYDPDTQTDGLEHLLVDHQIRTGSGPREHYRRHVYRVLDETGVRDSSQIQIEFAPSYETVVIHELAVYRGDSEVSRTTESGLRVLEREQRLEALVYDERKSILAILGDVRVGDRVEAAYTVRGDNPVFEGRYASPFSLAWNIPVRRFSLMLLKPRELVVNVRVHGTIADPVVTEAGGWERLHWHRVDVPAVLPESAIPAWFDPYPSLELSEYADWADVARWGLRLYKPEAIPSEPLRAKIAEIAQLHPEPDQRVLAALAFVRDEIRYLSLALGPHSHRPSSPDTALQRRSGDCKDKAVLLVALLEGLGIRSRAAFVDTLTGSHAAEHLPSPLAFDHVIVAVEHEGRVLWLDPTNLHARGSLDRLSCPRFGVALVLDEATTEPTSIEPTFGDEPGFDVQTEIDASGPGRDARMTVETTYSWASADSMRARFGEIGRAAMEEGYLDFYARLHPSIRAEGPLEIRDDESENVVVTTERYLVPDFWRLSEDGESLDASVSAPEISQLVSTPSTAARTMPLGVPHPVNVTCHISVRLPGSWELAPLRRRIETEAIRFGCDIRYSESVLDLYYDYESLKDSVPPENALAHVEQVGRILDVTRYDITRAAEGEEETLAQENQENEEREGRHWLVVMAFAAMSFVLTATIAAAFFFYRPKAPPADVEPADASLQGIGGWLAFAGIGILITPLFMLWNVIQTFPAFELSTWTALTSKTSDTYHALWAPVLLGELFCHIAMLNVSVVLVVLFLMKRRAFPRLFIASRIGWVLFLLIDSFLASSLPDIGPMVNPRLAGTVCSTVIWVLYFLNSRRVRATFVR